VGDFWSIPVDPTTGQATGEPSTFLALPGSRITQPTASAGGDKLVFYRTQHQRRKRLLALAGHEDAGTDRWGLQEWLVYSGGWSRDGRLFYYTSLKDPHNWDIYVSDLESGLERPVVQTPQMELFQCLTPDGSEFLFWQDDFLQRMPVAGGPAVAVMRSPFPHFYDHHEESVLCAVAPATRCLLAVKDGRETVFHELDFRNGIIGTEVSRAPGGYGFSLSPDGTTIAFMMRGEIHLLDLHDGSVLALPKVGWKGYTNHVSWSDDGTWLCAAGQGGEVNFWARRVDLEGTSELLWQDSNSINERCYAAPRVSPDGSRVALATSISTQDVWIAEEF
jgi:hypothetical protein